MKKALAVLLLTAFACLHAEDAGKQTKIAVDRTHHLAVVNQVGYEPGWPMRFTAPLSPDGTKFEIRPAKGMTALFRGTIQKGVGDFSQFRPPAGSGDFVVVVSGGSLGQGVSDPFAIGPDLFKAKFWQPAVDFLIDVRSVVGTHPSAFGGCPWRDGTYYDFAVPSLVLFFKADPATVVAMPRQIDWQADKRRVLDPSFKFDPKNACSEGVMDAVKRYYNEIEPPKPDAPDVVKLIHWGLGYYLVNPATKDWSGDPDRRRIHSQTIEQFAYLLAYWPAFEKWLPRSFYERCRDFAFENWEKSGSLGIDKWWGADSYITPEQMEGSSPAAGILHPYKGRHAPGHSIVPNLLMHEVAKREHRPDADRYLQAAVAQADWIVKNVDWNDPRTTKGQRIERASHDPQPRLAASTLSDTSSRRAPRKDHRLGEGRRRALGQLLGLPPLRSRPALDDPEAERNRQPRRLPGLRARGLLGDRGLRAQATPARDRHRAHRQPVRTQPAPCRRSVSSRNGIPRH